MNPSGFVNSGNCLGPPLIFPHTVPTYKSETNSTGSPAVRDALFLSPPEAYDSGMRGWGAKLVAVAMATTLAMPSGWCCAYNVAAEATPHRTSCCQKAARPQQASQQLPFSAPMEATCCCLDRVARPADLLTQAKHAALAVFALPPAPLPAILLSNVALPLPPIKAGPPLHVLLCVWRC